MKVNLSPTDDLAGARTAKRTADASFGAGVASFAAIHQAAISKRTPADTAVKSELTTATANRADTPVKPRKGEALQAVAGHSYSEVQGGDRDGMYVNTSGNKRHGKAFVLVERNGIEYHIYGQGKDRLVVALRPRTDDADTAPAATTPNTTVGSGRTTPTVSATDGTGAATTA